MDKLNEIMDVLDNMDEYELMRVWNDYTTSDDYIHGMDEFDDFIGYGTAPTDVLKRVDLDSFDTSDSFFVETIYGIKSLSSITDYDSPIDIESLANNALDNDEDYDNSDIRDILDYNPIVEKLTEIFETYGYNTDDITDNLDSDPEAIIETLIKIIKD